MEEGRALEGPEDALAPWSLYTAEAADGQAKRKGLCLLSRCVGSASLLCLPLLQQTAGWQVQGLSALVAGGLAWPFDLFLLRILNVHCI